MDRQAAEGEFPTDGEGTEVQDLPTEIEPEECIERVIDKREWDRRTETINWQALRLKPKEAETGAASVIRARIGKPALRARGRLIYTGFAGFGEASARRLLEEHGLRDSREDFLGHADLVYSAPPARVTGGPREPAAVNDAYEQEVAYYEALVPLFRWVPDADPVSDPWQGREFGRC